MSPSSAICVAAFIVAMSRTQWEYSCYRRERARHFKLSHVIVISRLCSKQTKHRLSENSKIWYASSRLCISFPGHARCSFAFSSSAMANVIKLPVVPLPLPAAWNPPTSSEKSISRESLYGLKFASQLTTRQPLSSADYSPQDRRTLPT